jgi:hypothetical protein
VIGSVNVTNASVIMDLKGLGLNDQPWYLHSLVSEEKEMPVGKEHFLLGARDVRVLEQRP